MTDRHKGYVVTLDRDIRDDDAEMIINAIRMIKSVITVEPIINDVPSMVAEARARTDITSRLLEALKNPKVEVFQK